MAKPFLAVTIPVFLVVSIGCHIVPFRNHVGKESQALILNREGIAAFERDQWDEASTKFTQAIKNDENDLNSRRYYAEILWLEGNRNEALRFLTDAATRDGSDEEKIEIYESLSEKFLTIDQPQAALNYADKVIDLAPKRHEGWELRGTVHRRIGKSEEASADYHKALHLAPNDQELLRRLATFESEIGDDQRALAVWEELGRFYPDHSEPVDVLCGKALACRKMGRKREAADYYAAAVKRDPEDSRLYALLAETHLENNDAAAAQTVAAQAADRFPSDPAARTLKRRVEEIGMADQAGKNF